VTTLAGLLADLDDEYSEARSLVASLGPDDPVWDRATPAEGWAVRDQVSHLAFFDEAALTALVDPDAFTRIAEAMLAAYGDRPDGDPIGGDPMEVHLGRSMVEAFADADPTARIPWFGPPMGVLSFLSARLMETWAHGQDVADALNLERPPTDRLRHVAHLGVRARPFSYVVHGRQLPPGSVEVVLTGPSGDEWRWQAGAPGVPPGAGSSVRGPALDFCLVVTQRRHPADTALVIEGEEAAEWMALAQAFAGPPGPGRPAQAG
jgi:uncharacterized protein (TIGR03084 family)